MKFRKYPGPLKFHGFGKSAYGSKEIAEALRTLEKAFLIALINPVTSATLPLMPSLQKSPRLQVLDTGILNYFVGVQKEIISTTDLSSVYQGRVIEHMVGQELLAGQFNALSALNFWVREKNTSTAEVDYVYLFEGKLIPIEVKSGKEGTLKSLHLFMNEAPHQMAVRFYSGAINITQITTPADKTYHLLSLPYYQVSQLEEYLNWFKKEIEKK